MCLPCIADVTTDMKFVLMSIHTLLRATPRFVCVSGAGRYIRATPSLCAVRRGTYQCEGCEIELKFSRQSSIISKVY